MEKQKKLPLSNKTYIQKLTLCLVREKTEDEKLKINSPELIAGLKLIKEELILSDREKFICLHLDVRCQLISYELISIGSLGSTIVHPREVYKSAILSNADSVIFCHNHPSGMPDPSDEDISHTKRLQEAGELLGIKVLDHLIFGEESHLSFKDLGLL